MIPKVIFRILSLFPAGFYYMLSDMLFGLNRLIFRYRRAVIHDNLRSAFPVMADQEIRTIASLFYRHFFDWIVETAAIPGMSRENVEERYYMVNPEILKPAFDRGENVLIILGHYNNWEGFSRTIYPTGFVFATLYKTQSNKIIDGYLRYSRGQGENVQMLTYNDFYRACADHHQEHPHCFIMLGDQRPRKKAKVRWINFLNQPTNIFRGVDNLVERAGVETYFGRIYKRRRGYYEITFIPIGKPGEGSTAQEITDSYFRHLEEQIREEPQYYLWSHNRWKHRELFDKAQHGRCDAK